MTIEENRNETGKQKKGSKNFIFLFIFFFSQEKSTHLLKITKAIDLWLMRSDSWIL